MNESWGQLGQIRINSNYIWVINAVYTSTSSPLDSPYKVILSSAEAVLKYSWMYGELGGDTIPSYFMVSLLKWRCFWSLAPFGQLNSGWPSPRLIFIGEYREIAWSQTDMATEEPMTGQVRRGAIQGQRKEQEQGKEQGKASWPFFGGCGQDRSIFSMGVWHFLGTFSLNSPKVNHIII